MPAGGFGSSATNQIRGLRPRGPPDARTRGDPCHPRSGARGAPDGAPARHAASRNEYRILVAGRITPDYARLVAFVDCLSCRCCRPRRRKRAADRERGRRPLRTGLRGAGPRNRRFRPLAFRAGSTGLPPPGWLRSRVGQARSLRTCRFRTSPIRPGDHRGLRTRARNARSLQRDFVFDSGRSTSASPERPPTRVASRCSRRGASRWSP
jgi:hypothetical protein